MSPGWVAVIVAIIGLVGSTIWVFSGMKSDIAVAGARIDALQSSQRDLRDEIHRLETSFETKLNHLSEIVLGRQPSRRPDKQN
jgi:hypothetical protein